ncbi:hypothetical protein [Clostridium estertheticum]|uniref:Novel STAND NTPase 3 domain-containing protein n=1 Tax=Clostridium estertheticum TaxID=238834 RepID=A0AA47EII2_9CLOT|nr:hypothetical protein [Clostridium estertheticum]MBU3156334.1 hypothetical protein [Clostridium estertheticum]WAG59601.1 hypothetical protein LL038_18495 [Clostridium estertheticum]
MYNFINMESHEFELLSKDIMEKALGIDLRTYTKGRDGGIDIRGYVGNDIIIQVKHFVHGNFSSLRNSLIKEQEKVKKLKPKRYIIVTSFCLTPQNENDIYNLFKPFMRSKEDIYDACRLDSILLDNIEIVKTHYKLWLISSDILNIISNNSSNIDISTLMYDFERKSELFVETRAYREAIKILESENLIMLSGEPGVGKTTLSKMLLAYFASQKYTLRYVSNKSVRDIKNMLLDDSKEIILLDDFLGQHYVELDMSKLEELKNLIIYISNKNNKKLILNSRITILNEALNNNQGFNNFIIDINVNKYILNVNEMNLLEKGKMLYKHIYFNRLSQEYYNEIQMDERYLKIIKHANFNPRIIEYITRKNKVKEISVDSYFEFIIKSLDNPKDIWKEEFEKFKKYDRIFMNTLYSLSNDFILEVILQESFNVRINNEENYDTTINIYNDCANRLADSLIIKVNNSIKIMNPSINDYIFHYLSENDVEVGSILKSTLYLEQLQILRKVNEICTMEFINFKILNQEFLKLKIYADGDEINYYYLYYISELNIKNDLLLESIYENLLSHKPFGHDKERNSDLTMRFFGNQGMVTYYKLDKLILDFNNLRRYYNYLNFNALKEFIPLHEHSIKQNINLMLSKDEIFKLDRLTSWEIELEIISLLNEEIDNIIVSNITDFEDEVAEENISLIKNVVSTYIDSLIQDRMMLLQNNSILCKNIHINNQMIFDEIDLVGNIYTVMSNNGVCTKEKYNFTKEDTNSYEELIKDLFDIEYIFTD